MLSKECVSLFAGAGANEPAARGLESNSMELSEDGLTRELQKVAEDADEDGDRWVTRAMSAVGGTLASADVGDKVKNFFRFVLEHNLQESMRVLSPRRILTLCIWHALLASPVHIYRHN